MSDFGLTFDNSFFRQLEGFHVPMRATPSPSPRLVRMNCELAAELGMRLDGVDPHVLASALSGTSPMAGSDPLAMVYAGHQFGGFSPQLGDGRALLLGEVIDTHGVRRDIHLKGSGRTPFSRGGDGKAVLGPVLREYLIGEAMYALGIPTTRALAAITTGEEVMREQPEPGAILVRVAQSHLRVGTFQYFAARGAHGQVRQLADYAIERHYPELEPSDDRYLLLFAEVMQRQAFLVAQWMLVGFVHGVMNTDNMTISGETIDYGPCAFIDAFDQAAVFSSIDEGGRYAYGNQPGIAQWNLARFAETLVPLIDPDDADKAVSKLTDTINRFPQLYVEAWLSGMRAKLGLTTAREEDLSLAHDLIKAMDAQRVDFTLLFRRLAGAVQGDVEPARALFADPALFDGWHDRWNERIAVEGNVSSMERVAAMNRVNPLYIVRNHKVEEALSAARRGDLAPFDRLLEAIGKPFEERPGFEEFAQPAPAGFGPYRTFCGT